MRIVVNTRLLIPGQLEGIGNFIRESFLRMVENHPEHEFIFLIDRNIDREGMQFPNLRFHRIRPAARHPFLFYFWFHLALPLHLKILKPDVFVSTDGFFTLKKPCKSLNIIHDLNFLHRPKDLPTLYSWYYNRYFPRYARVADRIATVSEYSKADIQTSYGIAADKIDVVYNGIQSAFREFSEDEKQQYRDRYASGRSYFVYVGSMHARKNVDGLLRAFELYKDRTGSSESLVLAGRKMFGGGNLDDVLAGMKHRASVVFTGRLATEELAGVLGSALGLVFIPHFEGFGIPVIEAFRSGVPVICSSVTSLPEVAAGAAILVNPDSMEEISEAMEKIGEDSELRKNLIEKGLNRITNFSWDKTSRLLWESVERTSQL